jgi:hypothetical protein
VCSRLTSSRNELNLSEKAFHRSTDGISFTGIGSILLYRPRPEAGGMGLASTVELRCDISAEMTVL